MVVLSCTAAACGGGTTPTGDAGAANDVGAPDAAARVEAGGGSMMDAATMGSAGPTDSGKQEGGNLQCTSLASCGGGDVCCATYSNKMLSTSCESGQTCPMGSAEVCDLNNPTCPPGEECRARKGSTIGICAVPRDGGTDSGSVGDAAAD